MRDFSPQHPADAISTVDADVAPPSGRAASADADGIRLATYNIRKSVGLDWRRRPGRTVQVLAELNADIVALQEADRRFGARRAVLTDTDLRDRTGLRVVPLDADGPSHGWHGNAILVGDRVDVHRVRGLDLPSLEPRGAIMADVTVGGTHMRITGVHMGLRAADRRRQAQRIIENLVQYSDGAHEIVLGDFNEWRRHRGCLTTFQERLDPVPHQPSFHTAAPIARLDRVLLGPGLMSTDAGVHRSETAQRASDHLPLWVTIRQSEPPGVPRAEEGAG